MKFMLFPELAQLSQALSHSSQECTVHTRIEAYSCKSVKKDKKLSKAMESSFLEVKAEIKQSVGSPVEDSQEDDALYASPFGPLNKSQARKTLCYLVALLNLAFPDYDFSEAKPDHFCKEVSGSSVLQALSATLSSVRTQSGPRLVYAPRSYSTYPPTSPELFGIGSPMSQPKSIGMGSPYASPSISPPKPLPPSAAASPPQSLSSGVHPMLFQVLDKVINLTSCDVFSYNPDMDSDPHADDSDSDYSDSEWSTSEDDDADSDGQDLLGFEDFHAVSHGSPPKPSAMTIINKAPYGRWEDGEDSGETHSPYSSIRKRRSAGGLLWSSHWFFYNKSLKRILFVTIWAKKRRAGAAGVDEREDVGIDRFMGWEGGVGAGARALGLNKRHTV